MTGTSQTGVELSRFAAVQAAEQDALPLEEALEREGVDEADWRDARKRVLLDIASSAATFKAYQRALEEAQDALFRSVTPLYDDLAAWIAYSEALGTAAGGAVMRESGLTLGDLARLERHWRKRFEADPALAEEAKALRDERREGPLPALTMGPRRQAPPSEAADVAREEAESPADDDHEGLERAAALEALLHRDARDEAFARRGAANREEARAIVAAATARLEAQPALAGFYRSRVEHHRRLLTQAVASPSPTFAPPTSPERLRADPAVVERALSSTSTAIDETTAIDPRRLELDALPFHRSAPVPRSALADEPPHDAAGETAALRFDDLDLVATPFEEPSRLESLSNLGPPPPATSIDETSFLDASALSFDDDALPFAPDPDAAPPAPIASELSPSSSVDETAALDVGLLSLDALPFDAAPERGEPNAIQTDLRRYASYRTELRRTPERTAAIRARYGVANETAHDALVAAWDRRFTREPRLATDYVVAVRAYGAWLDQHEEPER